MKILRVFWLIARAPFLIAYALLLLAFVEVQGAGQCVYRRLTEKKADRELRKTIVAWGRSVPPRE